MSFKSRALNSLLKRSTVEDHDEVLQACNATLKESRGDINAQLVKIIALIKSDHYNDALSILEDNGEKLQAKALLEHAYVLYKLGRQEEARKRVHGLGNNRGAKHVEAQASYRCEDFEQAATLYKELEEGKAAFEYEVNESRINASATDAQLAWRRQGDHTRSRKASRQDLEAFEAAYNTACGSIATANLNEAEFLLKRAGDLCDLSNDLSEEDKVAELLPILVQQFYVSTLLCKSKPAENPIQQNSLEKISDLSTRQVAQTNILAGSSNAENPYLAHRLFEALPALEANDVLFQFQKELMSYNQMALDLQISKFNGVANKTLKALADCSSAVSNIQCNVSVANAAARAQNQLGKLGIQSVFPLLKRRPKDVGLVVTIVHLYIFTKNYGSAIIVLEFFLNCLNESTVTSDRDIRHAPGLIALLVTLYSFQGRKLPIKIELVKAASYWRQKSKHPPALLHAAALSLLASSTIEDLQEANQLFRDLHAQNKQDRVALAGTVASSATTNPKEAQELASHLTPIARLTSGVDVDRLEKMDIPRLASDTKTSLSQIQAANEFSTRKKKRIRKSRLPDIVDSSKRVDPERWLPLRDRSTYRPKGKKGKQKGSTLTQGVQVERADEGMSIPASDAGTKSLGSILGGAPKAGKKRRSKK